MRCKGCNEKMTYLECRNNTYFCDKCIRRIDQVFEDLMKELQENRPEMDEAEFWFVMEDYIFAKAEQDYQSVKKKLPDDFEEQVEEIRRRLKEEQNLCQK